MGKGRVSAENLTGCYNVVNAGLCANHNVVSDIQVSNDTNLTPDRNMLAKFCAARNACLGHNDTVFSDYAVVSNLDQVIDFRSATYQGNPQSRSVNGGIGSNLYIVLNDDNSNLGNLLIRLT